MATHTINHDRTTQWKITGNNDAWTLGKDAELHVSGKPAIFVGATFHDNTINIDGDLINTGTDAYGIFALGAGTTINVGKNAEIKSAYGITAVGADAVINNQGTIDGGGAGIYTASTSHIVNSGEVSGYAGMIVGSDPAKKLASWEKTASVDDSVVNKKGGEIWGGEAGVLFQGDGNHRFVNDGFVTGALAAVGNRYGSLHLVNHGEIDGIVQFGNGDDILDTRHGTISDYVNGGGGNDTFLLSSKSIKLSEDFDGGYDTVKSSVSYTLADHFEKLVLIGKGNLIAHGSDDANLLQGNAGNNKIFGELGNDQLGGGKGTDFLTGGDGYDTFIFHKGDGVDTVTDFNDATDTMSLSGFAGVGNFSELSSHLSAHGDDVWVSFGSDKLILHDTALSDMNAADFLFPV